MISLGTTQPDVKLVLDGDGVIRQVNLANEMAGEPIDGWVGLPWADTVEDVESEQLTRLVAGTVDQGLSPFFQVTQRFPSGLTVPVEYMTVRLDNGAGLMAIGKDVRAVAQLQSRLAAAQQSMERGYWRAREVETRYRALFEASSDAMLVVQTEDFRIADANPAAIVALGLASGRPRDVANRDFLGEVALADRPLVKNALIRARERGQAPHILVHLGPNGDPWLVRTSLLVGDQPQSLLVQLLPAGESPAGGTRGGQASVGELIARSPDGFVLMDERGDILQANAAFLDLIQVGALGSAVGENLGRWLGGPGGDLAMLLESLQLNGSVRLFPSTIVGSLDMRTAVEISAVLSTDRRATYIAACVRDVSRRLDTAGQSARLGGLLSSLTEQLGRVSLRKLVGTTVGLVERHYIDAALELTHGNRTAAAKLLGVSRQSLYVKLGRYGIKDEEGSVAREGTG